MIRAAVGHDHDALILSTRRRLFAHLTARRRSPDGPVAAGDLRGQRTRAGRSRSDGARAVHAGHAGPVQGGHGQPPGAQRRRRRADGRGRSGHRRRARLALLPRRSGERLTGDRARAWQPRQLRQRIGAQLHGVQAQRPRLRLPGREPGNVGLHGRLARPGSADLLPGRPGPGHAPAAVVDRGCPRRALQGQPGAAHRRRQHDRRAVRRQARSLPDRDDGPLAWRRRGHELHRLQPGTTRSRPPVSDPRGDQPRRHGLRAAHAVRRPLSVTAAAV